MFTLLVHGKTRKNPAESNHVLEIPPTSQSRRESEAIVNDLESLLTSQEKAAASKPSRWSYWLQGGSPERGKKRRRGRTERRMGSSGVWQKWISPTGKTGEYTCIILHGLRVCVKSVMCCGEFLYCSESSCLTVAGELKQLFLKNYTSCLTRYTNSLLKIKMQSMHF